MEPLLINGRWMAADAPLGTFGAVNPSTRAEIADWVYPVSGWGDLAALLTAGRAAAVEMATQPAEVVADFLEAYARKIEDSIDALVETAHRETGLPREPRLRDMELPRTLNQLRQAAAASRERSWRRATIDTTHELRAMLGPLGGPVVVLGPNNFPFAYNGIAGGDFAAALAAGNPVIAKAHPAHPRTTQLLAEAALSALKTSGLPMAAVQLFYHTAPELGLRLVAAKETAAVAFTGSRPGGLALKRAADAAGTPIYLELSSVNPVFVLPGALRERGAAIATELQSACTLGGGQFCTKPGLLVLPAGDETEAFVAQLAAGMGGLPATTLLTAQIPRQMAETVAGFQAAGATLLVGGWVADTAGFGFQPTLLRVPGEAFLARAEALQSEAFGPMTMVIVAGDEAEMLAVATALEGNLTASIYSATDGADEEAYAKLAPGLRNRCGRLLNDKVPTGVAVSPAMNHGGPYPAAGHPGFTAVGFPASMIRFAALHSYDHVREHRLPVELWDANPTGAMGRMIDGTWTTAAVGRAGRA